MVWFIGRFGPPTRSLFFALRVQKIKRLDDTSGLASDPCTSLLKQFEHCTVMGYLRMSNSVIVVTRRYSDKYVADRRTDRPTYGLSVTLRYEEATELRAEHSAIHDLEFRLRDDRSSQDFFFYENLNGRRGINRLIASMTTARFPSLISQRTDCC